MGKFGEWMHEHQEDYPGPEIPIQAITSLVLDADVFDIDELKEMSRDTVAQRIRGFMSFKRTDGLPRYSNLTRVTDDGQRYHFYKQVELLNREEYEVKAHEHYSLRDHHGQMGDRYMAKARQSVTNAGDQPSLFDQATDDGKDAING